MSQDGGDRSKREVGYNLDRILLFLGTDELEDPPSRTSWLLEHRLVPVDRTHEEGLAGGRD